MNARMAKMSVAALFLGATLTAPMAGPVWATPLPAWTTPGQPCSEQGALANSDGFLVCDGGVWTQRSVRLGGNIYTCDSDAAGTIRWSGSAFEGCDGSSWIQLAGGAAGLRFIKRMERQLLEILWVPMAVLHNPVLVQFTRT